MYSLNRSFRQPLLKVAPTVWMAALLCGWLAADPRAVLNFWPGVLIGTLGAIVGWRKWRATSTHYAKHRCKVFAVVLIVWFALAFVPQRDIPVIAAPFGIWLALTMTATLDYFKWKRS